MTTSKPYGVWETELTAKQLAGASQRYGHLQVDLGILYWVQSDPEAGGRQTIFRYKAGEEITDIVPQGYSVRSRVHEYGGGDFTIRDGVLVFVNDSDQRLYRIDNINEDGTPTVLTESPQQSHGYRYADMHIHPSGRWLVAVRESHPESHDPNAVVNELVLLDLHEEHSLSVLATGDDFYSYPRFSPEGNEIAWLSWSHPNMPWDDTTLWLATFNAEGTASEVKALMDNIDEAIYQPSWCPDGELHFVSDRSNWWNIYSLRDDVLNALTPMTAEFGFPQWQFGIRSYQFLDNNRLAAVYSQNGYERLCVADTDTGTVHPVDLPFCDYQGGLQRDGDLLMFIAASERLSPAIYSYNLMTEQLHLISGEPDRMTTSISVAEPFEFPTSENDQAHAFFYAPVNDDFETTPEELPPAIVMIHGGPTGSTSAALNASIQFWTQRGFAVIDVNYRGSTGFGRAYRDRLKYQWGIFDVDDCIAAVQYLVEQKRIDPDRVAIRGGSAGGFTVYKALQESDVFKAGVSRYGVADLAALAKDTHKFELKYLDQMIGKWPEEKSIYDERSPINHADKFNCPMLLLQGDEDAVVPPEQSIEMGRVLDEKQIPHQVVMLVGEQHGFRRSENIAMALELELNFYRQVFRLGNNESLAELTLKHQDKL